MNTNYFISEIYTNIIPISTDRVLWYSSMGDWKGTLIRHTFSRIRMNMHVFKNWANQTRQEVYLQLLPADIWHLHIVCWRTHIFILFAGENIKANKMNLHSQTEISMQTHKVSYMKYTHCSRHNQLSSFHKTFHAWKC